MKTGTLKRIALLCALMMLCMAAVPAMAEEKTTLTMWAALNAKSARSVTTNADIVSIQKTEEATGIHIEWTEPPVGDEASQFNLMIANPDNYPDMIAWNWWNYPGGPEKAISDGILIDLTPYIDQMPNLKALYEKYPELKKQCTTDEGHTYFFPRINGDALDPEYHAQSFWVGPIYRKDILDALNLAEPVTIDDWYTVLTAVKENYPDMIPFTAAGATTANTSIYTLASVFGTRPNLYLDHGQVNFGLLSDEFKQFVETMAKWYEEELLDPDYLANSANDLRTKVTSGEAFAFIGAQGGNYVTYAQVMAVGMPEAQLQIGAWPTGPDGVAYTSQAGVINTVNGGFGIGITTACKNVEAALKYLDYGYSDEGIMLNNFGVENETYVYDADGNIQWMEAIQAEIDASSVDDVLGRYLVCGITTWASLCDVRTFKLMRTYPGQYEAGEIWGQASDALDLPPLTPTTDESGIVAPILNNVQTYRDEVVGNIIQGLEGIEAYDTMVEQAKQMGIEQVVEIYNAALVRYQDR
ncbi:MAG: extracellular solute-binding protein [Clostridia bacterium]|nr:extracellular solute-binding protein [Clostridia bacterium]